MLSFFLKRSTRCSTSPFTTSAPGSWLKPWVVGTKMFSEKPRSAAGTSTHDPPENPGLKALLLKRNATRLSRLFHCFVSSVKKYLKNPAKAPSSLSCSQLRSQKQIQHVTHSQNMSRTVNQCKCQIPVGRPMFHPWVLWWLSTIPLSLVLTTNHSNRFSSQALLFTFASYR